MRPCGSKTESTLIFCSQGMTNFCRRRITANYIAYLVHSSTFSGQAFSHARTAKATNSAVNPHIKEPIKIRA